MLRPREVRGPDHLRAGGATPQRAITQRPMPARSGCTASIRSPRAAGSRLTASACPRPISAAKIPPGASSRQIGGDGAIGREPVLAAVERAMRVVIADFGRQLGDARAWRCRAGWRRSTSNRAGNRRPPNRRRQNCARSARPSSRGIATRGRAAPAAISTPIPLRLRKLRKQRQQQAAGAGAEIEEALAARLRSGSRASTASTTRLALRAAGRACRPTARNRAPRIRAGR